MAGPYTLWPAVFLLMLLALLADCTAYPLGLNKDQWDGLTPAQQTEYRARQAEINAQNYRAAEAVHA